jgi:hypothetical protein
MRPPSTGEALRDASRHAQLRTFPIDDRRAGQVTRAVAGEAHRK